MNPNSANYRTGQPKSYLLKCKASRVTLFLKEFVV